MVMEVNFIFVIFVVFFDVVEFDFDVWNWYVVRIGFEVIRFVYILRISVFGYIVNFENVDVDCVEVVECVFYDWCSVCEVYLCLIEIDSGVSFFFYEFYREVVYERVVDGGFDLRRRVYVCVFIFYEGGDFGF